MASSLLQGLLHVALCPADLFRVGNIYFRLGGNLKHVKMWATCF